MWIMILFLAAILLLVVVGQKQHVEFSFWPGYIAIPVMILSILTLGVLLFTGIIHFTARTTVAKHEAITQTIEEFRERGVNPIESATIFSEVVEMNKTIAAHRRWNESHWRFMVPKGHLDGNRRRRHQDIGKNN